MCVDLAAVWTWSHRLSQTSPPQPCWVGRLHSGADQVSTCCSIQGQPESTVSWMLESLSLFWDIIYPGVASTHVSGFVPELIWNQSVPSGGNCPSDVHIQERLQVNPCGHSVCTGFVCVVVATTERLGSLSQWSELWKSRELQVLVLPSWCLPGLRGSHGAQTSAPAGASTRTCRGLLLSALLSPLQPLLGCPSLDVLQLCLPLFSQELNTGLQMWSGCAGADTFLFSMWALPFGKCNLSLCYLFVGGEGARMHIADLLRILCPLEPFSSSSVLLTEFSIYVLLFKNLNVELSFCISFISSCWLML